MSWTPVARIIVRYGVGIAIGMDAGNTLAADPDVITLVAAGLGLATEVIYSLAKRKGWAT